MGLLYFDKVQVVEKAGCSSMCKKCGKEMQGLVVTVKTICLNHDFFPNPSTYTERGGGDEGEKDA